MPRKLVFTIDLDLLMAEEGESNKVLNRVLYIIRECMTNQLELSVKKSGGISFSNEMHFESASGSWKGETVNIELSPGQRLQDAISKNKPRLEQALFKR